MKQWQYIALLLILSTSLSAFSYKTKRDLRGSSTESFASQGARLVIKSVKTRYNKTEDIFLNLELHNDGFYPITIYLNKNYLRNFTLIVRKEKGASLPMKDITYFKEYKDYRDPFFRDYTATAYHSRAIIIQPGESFQRRIRLQDVVRFDQLNDIKNHLTVNAYFYPNPMQNPDIFLASANQFNLVIDKGSRLQPVQEPVFPTRALSLTPREAVFLTLAAEFSRDWPNFFKYISLRDLIKYYPIYARRYANAQRESRVDVLNGFRTYLMDKQRSRLVKFEIQKGDKTDKLRGIAQVRVKATRLIEGFRREFLYTYYLTRAHKLWQITGIESQLIK